MEQKEKSISKNSLYYMAYEVLNVVFPFLTGMYVARILLPTAVGTVSYAQNIARYFVILSYLGIPTYGMREIAKARYDGDNLCRVFSELALINLVSTAVFGILYLVLVFSVPAFREDLRLYLITGGGIALNALNISWLYSGLEEFRYVSIRNLVFKVLCFLAMLCLVKSTEDYFMYAAITVMGTAGNRIINVLYAPHFVRFTTKNLNFRRHLKPIAKLAVANLAIELYSLVDTTMLGAISAKENVAYYTYAKKIHSIFTQFINSFTMVIVPRLAFYHKSGETRLFSRLVSKDLETIFVFGIPLIIGLQIVARDAIVLIYGEAFAPSAAVLRILAFLLVIAPTGYLLGSRMLLVTNHESQMILCVAVGAVLNVLGNAILIPRYTEIGAAAASVFSELCVMAIYVILGRKYYRLTNVAGDAAKMLLAGALMGAAVYFLGTRVSSLLWKVAAQVAAGTAVYFALLYAMRESIVREYADRAIRRFFGKGGSA